MVPHTFNPNTQGKWRQVVSSKPTTGYIETLPQKKERERRRRMGEKGREGGERKDWFYMWKSSCPSLCDPTSCCHLFWLWRRSYSIGSASAGDWEGFWSLLWKLHLDPVSYRHYITFSTRWEQFSGLGKCEGRKLTLSHTITSEWNY